MSIKVQIGDAALDSSEIKVSVKTSEEELQRRELARKKEENLKPKFEMNARKTLDGNVVIFDHVDMDIVVMPKEKKVLALMKDIMSDSTYEAQSRLFDYLKRKGVILFDSVQGGNIYGSMEAIIPEPEAKQNPIKVAIFTIGKFLEEEKPYFMWSTAIEDQQTDHMLHPNTEDSTELGEVPQKAKKGSIPKYSRRSIAYKTYFEE